MKTDNIKRFYLLQFLHWGAWAAFGQFYSAYLVELGYTSKDIGIAFTVFTLMSVVGQYVFGFLCDMKKTIKKVYVVIVGLCILFVMVFFNVVENKFLTYIVIAAIGFSWMPKGSILDSWIMNTDGIDLKNYGKFRWWGSLGYALITSVFGKVIGLYGWHMMVTVFIGMSLIELIIVFFATDAYVEQAHHERIHPRELLSNKLYVLLIVFAVFIGAGKFMILNFYIFVFEAVGGDANHMGLAASVAAFVEIPLFFVSGKIINRFKPTRILLFCSVMYLIRIILTWHAVTPTQIILIAIIQAIGFAFILSTGRVLVARIAPDSLKTTAQGIFSAAFFSVSGIIASLTGGFLIDNMGMDTFYFVSTLFVSIGVVLMLVINLMSNVGQTKARVR